LRLMMVTRKSRNPRMQMLRLRKENTRGSSIWYAGAIASW
jgi:hypothetical protein